MTKVIIVCFEMSKIEKRSSQILPAVHPIFEIPKALYLLSNEKKEKHKPLHL